MECAPSAVIMDFLQVTQSEQLDIALPEAPVRYRRTDRRNHECLAGLVELEIQVRLVAEVGPSNKVEPLAFPGPGKLTEISQLAQYCLTVEHVTSGRHVGGFGHFPLSLLLRLLQTCSALSLRSSPSSSQHSTFFPDGPTERWN